MGGSSSRPRPAVRLTMTVGKTLGGEADPAAYGIAALAVNAWNQSAPDDTEAARTQIIQLQRDALQMVHDQLGIDDSDDASRAVWTENLDKFKVFLFMGVPLSDSDLASGTRESTLTLYYLLKLINDRAAQAGIAVSAANQVTASIRANAASLARELKAQYDAKVERRRAAISEARDRAMVAARREADARRGAQERIAANARERLEAHRGAGAATDEAGIGRADPSIIVRPRLERTVAPGMLGQLA